MQMLCKFRGKTKLKTNYTVSTNFEYFHPSSQGRRQKNFQEGTKFFYFANFSILLPNQNFWLRQWSICCNNNVLREKEFFFH